MIQTYNVENITGGLENAFQNVMRIGFVTTITILTIWLIVGLLIWLFRSQEKI